MKIICIEEHAVDAGIANAIHSAIAVDAPYMAHWGSSAEDEPESFGDNRPHLLPPKKAFELARDMDAARIAEMDAHGIDMQVLSYSNAAQLAPPNEAVELTRSANDRLAEAVRSYPTRFAGFATLPWQDPLAAADELVRAVSDLGLKGTLLSGRPGMTFLDDQRYEPVLAKLNELQVPIYVHPGFPLEQVRAPYYGDLTDELTARLSLFGWGWHNEAGIHVIRLILSGKFEKFPRLQLISGHWGEMVPFYLQRLDDMIPQQATGLSRSISETYKSHVYVSPSGMLNLPHFDFIRNVIGAERIIYSIDYPFLTHSGARIFLETLPISEEEKELIGHANAEKLLRL